MTGDILFFAMPLVRHRTNLPVHTWKIQSSAVFQARQFVAHQNWPITEEIHLLGVSQTKSQQIFAAPTR